MKSHYISITEAERAEMLQAIGVATTDDLFADVPAEKRFPRLDLPAPMSEPELVRELLAMSGQNANALSKSIFLGAGAYNHFVPAAVDQILRRGEFYTAYTPYQPEVSQGTLQSIFEYQSLVASLTGMEIANASHYDGATAIAEAAIMALNVTRGRRKIVVARGVNPQYRAVLRTYLQALDVTVTGDETPDTTTDDALALVDDQTALLIVQSPDFLGRMHDLRGLAAQVQAKGALLCVHFDPTALGLFQTPGEIGADIATAEGQPLGIGLNFGGPYLGIFTTRQKYVHKIAVRIVGITKDVDGQMAYVLTLRAREQDIRRERATSNICTNQGLMALASTVYMSLMGKQGMRTMAELCYHRAHYAAAEIAKLPGYRILGDGPFFKEFAVGLPRPAAEVNAALRDAGIVGGYDLSADEPQLGDAMLLAVTEMNSRADIDRLVGILRDVA
ncbi:aminomethyl-transferring glycine dehydrogenase subunit GcvPA [Oscillochloris sp. ZM17-4]|uniref:aminomethyl-transferring glycine dehydrogenase subunit GcvPA n=1 Tax=Oscillochloris sp. ZM17-4 TaxID=2866714 RepID=UPI001C72C03A|nr:aminomethyl-transferring glycine dehydrogenase subunit GcvPA [Oscillochloris sp. ZM17-4]MBX0330948.1 aminomethyl-transferring glycine dehydrogenase subunit GcvPA [Oscillochloris sp. ZM17-4]